MRRDTVVIWYVRCPRCRALFTGTTERQALYRAREHMAHKHNATGQEPLEAKSVEVELS